MNQHVVITGFMGVGKTTAANDVADRLSLPHRDSDDDLQRLLGRSGREVAELLGIDELHRLESAVLLGALASPERLVITAAASTVEDPMCRAALGRNAMTIVLDAPLDEILDRASAGSHRRSIDRSELERLVDRRLPFFNEVADMMVSATGTRSDMVNEIVAFIAPAE